MGNGNGSLSVVDEGAASADGHALAACLLRHWNRIVLIIEYRTNEELRRLVDVEDLAQEVVVEALSHQTQFEYQGEERFTRWISTVARRVVSAWARAGARIPPALTIHNGSSTRVGVRYSQVPGTARTPSRLFVIDESLDRLRKALQSLSQAERTAITMIHLEGYTIKECAAAIGCSKEAAAKRLYRGLDRLARELEAYGT